MSEKLFELRRRTFDTPHFRGIEFIEVEAKSILNPVPGNYLPFNWTINPYRGCSHACTYCASGETPILLADGRTRPLAELVVGDRIYGTTFDGKYRRYVTTEVRAQWSTIKEAYRVVLEDGTELIASGDHRFLASHRGWKHVVNTPSGHVDRAHLTLNDKLLGMGGFAEEPKHNEDYKLGYLCGLVRGDAHLGSYSYLRAGSDRFRVHTVNQFRLALVDREALNRATAFLSGFGIEIDERLFQAATGNRKELRAISNNSAEGVKAIQSLIRWPRTPNDGWSKGFLAGIFDAEGSFSQGIWRLSNTDQEILDRVQSALTRFGFSFMVESQKPGERRKPVYCIRMLGQLREKVRFFHTVDTAITRKRTFEGTAIKSNAKLKVMAVEPLGFEIPMYDITTGTGDFIANGVVSHNCFARATHTYLDMNAGRDFETKIVVKVNAPDLLSRQLRRKSWKGESIAMGTATDPYQRAEGRYKLMPRIIRTLTEFRNPFSILTKGTLILRDIELLAEAARRMEVSTAFSIGTLDEEVWRKSEPGTPHPRRRVEAVARLNEAGIPCGVLVAPLLPGISDGEDQMREVIKACLDAGATHVSPILLHLRPHVREVYMEWLGEHYPDLVPMYRQMYPRAYAAKIDQDRLGARFGAIRDSLGGAPRKRARPRKAPATRSSEQLSLL